MTGSDFVSLPAAVASVFHVTAADGAILPIYEWRDAPPPPAPVLLFGHCTGFSAGSYRSFFARLARHARVFAFDARGHGGSAWPDGPPEDVFGLARYVDDLRRIGQAVTARAGGPPHYAGHSLNGRAALRLEIEGAAPAWPSLTLFEPPIFPPADEPDHAEAVEKQGRLVRSTERRVAVWPDRESLVAFLKGRGIFGVFSDDDLAQQVRATLRPDAGGGWRLCCPPEIEAATFRSVRDDRDSWTRLGSVTRPLVLVRGDPTLPDRDWITGASATIAARMPGARLITLPGAGHMMMFEQPERCVEILAEQIGVTPPSSSRR